MEALTLALVSTSVSWPSARPDVGLTPTNTTQHNTTHTRPGGGPRVGNNTLVRLVDFLKVQRCDEMLLVSGGM